MIRCAADLGFLGSTAHELLRGSADQRERWCGSRSASTRSATNSSSCWPTSARGRRPAECRRPAARRDRRPTVMPVPSPPPRAELATPVASSEHDAQRRGCGPQLARRRRPTPAPRGVALPCRPAAWAASMPRNRQPSLPSTAMTTFRDCGLGRAYRIFEPVA